MACNPRDVDCSIQVLRLVVGCSLLSGSYGHSVRNTSSVSRWFTALRDVQKDKIGFLPTGLSPRGTSISPKPMTGFNVWRLVLVGWLAVSLHWGFWSPPFLLQTGGHRAVLLSSFTYLSCVTFLFLCVFQIFYHNLCECLKLFYSLFRVESSYSSYSDSSNSLNHFEVFKSVFHGSLSLCFCAL